jgi:acyl-CoA synthetase (AMP-forming)/AMP-acid ligase II
MASVAQALRRAAQVRHRRRAIVQSIDRLTRHPCQSTPTPQVNPQGLACITHRGPDRPPATTTYAALHKTTSQIARALSRWTTTGEGGGQQRIALLCRNHELALVYLLAAAEMGAIAAPLNTRWAAPEAAAALADCGEQGRFIGLSPSISSC